MRIHIFGQFSNRRMFSALVAMVGLLIIDSSIVKVSVYTGGLYPTQTYALLFIILVLVYSLVQQLILNFVRVKTKQAKIRTKTHLSTIFNIVSGIQYLIIFLLVTIVFQIIFTSTYNLGLLRSILYCSFLLGSSVMGILAFKFFLWSRNERSLLVITYLIAVSLISVNAIFALLYHDTVLSHKPDYIRAVRGLSGAFTTGGNFYSSIFNITYVLSFVFTWAATALLLRTYSNLRGKIKFWIMIFIPLIFFFGQFQSLVLDLLHEYRKLNPPLFGVIYTISFSATKPIGGILFGLAFWAISRRINQKEIKDYMMISAFGIMLLFTSNQITSLILVPFPPFGIVTTAFFGLASYLILVGIYSSAISVSEDMTIRKYIRHSAKQFALLDGIGSSQMKYETEKIVTKVMRDINAEKESLEQTTGVSSSLQDEDFKEYLNLVIKETKKMSPPEK
jgi:hypothetical protein